MSNRGIYLDLPPTESSECETINTAPIRRFGQPVEPDAEQMMRVVSQSGTLDFWDSAEEDIYSLEDGEPFS